MASLGAGALARLISNLLDLDRDDIKALTETRGILELHSAQLAAQRASKAAIADIKDALEAFRAEVEREAPLWKRTCWLTWRSLQSTQNLGYDIAHRPDDA